MQLNKSNGSYSDGEQSMKDPRDVKQSSRYPTKAMTTLDTSHLEKLILDHQKLNIKIKKLIASGVDMIEKDSFQNAIDYLQQAQNILEYAANCGKSIDRQLITATLQNKACIYQRLWQQQKSYNYLQAILYNLNAGSKNHNMEQFAQNSVNLMHRKQTQALYQLKFSAVASQIKNHEIALSSAFKAMKILQFVCKNSYELMLSCKYSQQAQKSQAILKQVGQFQLGIDIAKMNDYMKRTKSTLLALKKTRKSTISLQIREQIQSFTIGQVMQIFPVTVDQLIRIPSIQQQTRYIGAIFKALYFSISFFAVATQLRLITPSKIKHPKLLNSEQYVKSEIYHLNAIYICAKLIPYPTNYLSHIIKSYSNHYESDIKDENTQIFQEEEIQLKGNLILHTDRKKNKNNYEEQFGFHNNDDQINQSRKQIRVNTIHRSKKSGLKIRNSSAQINSAAKHKKSLSKQKSTCTIKRSHKIIHIPNIKQQPIQYKPLKPQAQNAYHKKDKKQQKSKVQPSEPTKTVTIGSTQGISGINRHTYGMVGGSTTKNKSSKSKSKSPSINMQSNKKIKSPSKKSNKKSKFMQQYYLSADLQKKSVKNADKVDKKKQQYSKFDCEYKDKNMVDYNTNTGQSMKVSASDMRMKSKFEELAKNIKNRDVNKKD